MPVLIISDDGPAEADCDCVICDAKRQAQAQLDAVQPAKEPSPKTTEFMRRHFGEEYGPVLSGQAGGDIYREFAATLGKPQEDNAKGCDVLRDAPEETPTSVLRQHHQMHLRTSEMLLKQAEELTGRAKHHRVLATLFNNALNRLDR